MRPLEPDRTALSASGSGRFFRGVMFAWLLLGPVAAATADRRLETTADRRSASIVLTPDESLVCAVNQDSASVSLWGLAAGSSVREVTVGAEPSGLALSPDGRHLYVACRRGQTLSVVNLQTARRGRRLFHSRRVGCSRCHKGPYLTRSGRGEKVRLADVGTGVMADVPSLRDLWETAPYLHDGRARSLLDVMTKHNPDDRHGRTRDLTRPELDDLRTFLLAPFDEEE